MSKLIDDRTYILFFFVRARTPFYCTTKNFGCPKQRLILGMFRMGSTCSMQRQHTGSSSSASGCGGRRKDVSCSSRFCSGSAESLVQPRTGLTSNINLRTHPKSLLLLLIQGRTNSFDGTGTRRSLRHSVISAVSSMSQVWFSSHANLFDGGCQTNQAVNHV